MYFFNLLFFKVVAFIWDKETVGYYAFAIRIFQICLAIFPFLIREVLRPRMYFHLAETKNRASGLKNLIFPMSIYGVITSIFWLVTYWWSMFGVDQIAEEYKSAVTVLNILIFSLLPLGIAKICSDYLCSRVYNKMKFVICSWTIGIVFQIVCILFTNRIFPDIFHIVPVIYVLSTMMVYFCVVGYVFCIGKKLGESLISVVNLFLPLVIALLSVLIIRSIFDGTPSLDAFSNLYFSSISILITGTLSCCLIWSKKLHKFRKNAI